ncbi:MAG TPA: hypothetical protein PKK00_14505 [Bacteroidales bacterium]|nr:hypothetical protein [Bacteroidales bacterium]HPS18411.1 hypothetical protein [Bacteroidales bacterium]
MKKLLIILIAITALAEGCKKYEEGPCFSLRSAKKRMTGTWKIDKFYINGIDSTIEYFSKLGCKIEFTNEVYNLADNNNWKLKLTNCITDKVYLGFWYFYNEKNKININFLADSSFLITNSIGPFGNDRNAIWTILRLSNKELKIKVEDYYDFFITPHTSTYIIELKKI